MNKRIVFISLCSILGILAFFIGYLLFNPPLYSNGYSTITNTNGINYIIEVKNNGIKDIKIKNVYVNDKELPHEYYLAISKTHGLIVSDMLVNPHITFHPIHDYAIQPALSFEEQAELSRKQDFNHPRFYGVLVRHDNEVRNITIKYTYFLIPFTISREIIN